MKNYIWDFDGTLFDTYPVMMVALTEIMAQHGIQYEGDLAYYVKRYSIRQFASDYATPAFLADYHALESELQTTLKVYDGIPEILADIVAKGGQNFVVSHRDDKTYAYLGDLASYFADIITSDHGFARKPDPESLIYLMTKYDLNPAETMMIGDRPLDILAGQNAGITTLLFDEANLFPDNAVKADQVIHTWKEFYNEH